ncbi:hypothetical protein [Marinobacter sp. P4B1]|uniref:hypothetical protein n=1 Tax=Marinobacter sp. P4B1 TaxID=1119533 RepID=UPI00071D4287|nr:hypothetical protein [Marinobacter sp. P4B1]KRW83722.1 hypothetical protein AQ621_16870 [Marinobacter sp. P4B1]
MSKLSHTDIALKMIRSFVRQHGLLNLGPIKRIKETEIEDRATEILIEVKTHWDIEGSKEIEVIQMIRQELLHAVFSRGLEVELENAGTSGRFDGPIPINF